MLIAVSVMYLSVVVQLSGFDCRVTEEQSSDQEVVPGAQQVLVCQQRVLVSHEDLKIKEKTDHFTHSVLVRSS